jgi:hypothetical protein
LYALTRACVENLPVAIGSMEILYYFDGGKSRHCMTRQLIHSCIAGVPRKIPIPNSTNFMELGMDKDTFILWDSVGKPPAPPWFVQRAPVCVAVATSPQESRWDWAEKDFYYSRYFHVSLPSVVDISRMRY